MAEIKFKRLDITILSFDPSRILVKWVLQPTVLPLQNYTFRIERSHNTSAFAQQDKLYYQPPRHYQVPDDLPEGNDNATHLGTVPGNTLDFVDYLGDLHDVNKRYFYRIVATNSETGNVLFSPVGTWEGEPSLVAAEMIRRLHWLLDDRTGEPCFYFQQMSEGPQCPECWDYATSRTTDPDCPHCMGTGRHIGYFRPILTMIDFYPDNKVTQHAGWGETQPNEMDILISNYPQLNNRAIIIKAVSNRAYRIDSTRLVEEPGSDTIIHQVARVTEVNRSDVENKLEIPEEIRVAAADKLRERKEKREF